MINHLLDSLKSIANMNQIIRLSLFLISFLSFSCIVSGQDNTIKNIIISEGLKSGHSAVDLDGMIIYNDYTSNRIRHVYANQGINQLPVHETYIAYHTNGIIKESQFKIIEDLNSKTIQDINNLDPLAALKVICEEKSHPFNINESNIISSEGVRKETKIEAPFTSEIPIKSKLWYYLNEDVIKLAWEFEIDIINSPDYMQYFVDAETGDVFYELNYTITCDFGNNESHVHTCDSHTHHTEPNHIFQPVATDSSYVIFPYPLESPHDGSRVEVTRPWLDNLTASPAGWHSFGGSTFQHTRGNNVDAYEDTNSSNGPTGGNDARADGGSNLDFDFPWSTGTPLTQYLDASITNLFYWNNLCHDVWYNYGFDEPSGNFQEENYYGAGAASDYVRAECQDASGTCNANMSTPPDGGNGRMQMYNCGSRDGSFDNVVVVHEYGHGISIRMTGGPATSSCLNSAEQMGEGWSDWFGIVMTIKPGDVGTSTTGVGTWLFGQGPNGNGIRPYPYTTDMNINPFTYDALKTNISRPHGIGSVWATMLWDMTWGLIDEHGFDPDIYNGTGGNNIAMALVIEGIKLQPCGPGFVDGRDAILMADSMLYNGANHEIIWKAFARRGLGYSADQGSSYNRYDGQEAFDLPPSFGPLLTVTPDKLEGAPGEIITYTVKAVNNTSNDFNQINLNGVVPDSTIFQAASDGGTVNGTKVEWPVFNLLANDSIAYTYSVQIDPARAIGTFDLFDDVEGANTLWTLEDWGSTEWETQTGTSNSPTTAWFADDQSGYGFATLEINNTVGITDSSQISFFHFYNTEFTWDGGRVQYSTDQGLTWNDTETLFTQNGYNSRLYDNPNIPGFSGNSGGFIESIIDLSSFDEESILFRFQMENDASVGDEGWYIDDIDIDNLHRIVDNSVELAYEDFVFKSGLEKPTFIIADQSPFTISFDFVEVSCGGSGDGEATVIPSNPNGVYTYSWDTGGNTQTISNLDGGVYNVTVSNGSFSASGSVFVPGPTQSIVRDTSDNGGELTLRYKMVDDFCPNDTIYFHMDIFGDTINVNGQIQVQGTNTLIGLGKSDLFIDGLNADIIFNVGPGRTLHINDMTLRRGNSPNPGGAIYNGGTLTLHNVKIQESGQGGTSKALSNRSATLIISGNTEMN